MNWPINMPALSDTMSEGRLVRWLKAVGDPIHRGEPIAEIETDKAVMELEAYHDGYLAGPLVSANVALPVGTVVGYISDDAPREQSSSEPARDAALSEKNAHSQTASFSIPVTSGDPASERHPTSDTATEQRRSPPARRRAFAHRPASAVVLPPMAPAAEPSKVDSQNAGLRSSVRTAMARNVIKAAGTPTFRMEARIRACHLPTYARTSELPVTLLLARALALCIKSYPLFNALYTPEGAIPRSPINMGILLETSDGPVAPVLGDVGNRPLQELAGDWRSLRDQAVKHRLSLVRYEGGTFYLSNLGRSSFVERFDAVLPVTASGMLCVPSMHTDTTVFTLICDHRVISGGDAVKFLAALADRLSDPGSLFGSSSQDPMIAAVH